MQVLKIDRDRARKQKKESTKRVNVNNNKLDSKKSSKEIKVNNVKIKAMKQINKIIIVKVAYIMYIKEIIRIKTKNYNNRIDKKHKEEEQKEIKEWQELQENLKKSNQKIDKELQIYIDKNLVKLLELMNLQDFKFDSKFDKFYLEYKKLQKSLQKIDKNPCKAKQVKALQKLKKQIIDFNFRYSQERQKKDLTSYNLTSCEKFSVLDMVVNEFLRKNIGYISELRIEKADIIQDISLLFYRFYSKNYAKKLIKILFKYYPNNIFTYKKIDKILTQTTSKAYKYKHLLKFIIYRKINKKMMSILAKNLNSTTKDFSQKLYESQVNQIKRNFVNIDNLMVYETNCQDLNKKIDNKNKRLKSIYSKVLTEQKVNDLSIFNFDEKLKLTATEIDAVNDSYLTFPIYYFFNEKGTEKIRKALQDNEIDRKKVNVQYTEKDIILRKKLTNNELNLFDLLRLGLSKIEICKKLNISDANYRKIKSRIKRKFESERVNF